jgi:WD40 repeat protein
VTSLAIGYGFLAAGYASGHIRLFNLESKTLAVEITAHSRAINAIDLHPTLPLVKPFSYEQSFQLLWLIRCSSYL